MASVRQGQNREDGRFWVLSFLAEHPKRSQYDTAQALGVSLGNKDYCLNAIVKTGQVKLRNFGTPNKLEDMYVHRPRGNLEKVARTGRFLQGKLAEYRASRAVTDALLTSLKVYRS